jgi:hypothetical protein
MGSVVKTTMAPAKLYGKSPWGLHINVYGLAIRMPAGSHAYGCLVEAEEVVGTHHIIE